jgi:hypothetical protein
MRRQTTPRQGVVVSRHATPRRSAAASSIKFLKDPSLEGQGLHLRQNGKIAQRQQHCQRSEGRNEACGSAVAAPPGVVTLRQGAAPARAPPVGGTRVRRVTRWG